MLSTDNGVTVSLGFATYENYSYVFHWANEWDIDPYQMAIWRSYSAIPLHGLCGCIMGFYFGLYSFTAKFKYLILSLLLPYLTHGFYNFFSHPYHFVVLGMSTIFVVGLHTHYKKEQFNKLREQETKKI
jgi:RsiW-degrading membrane proteinase PrsW (M82 family)